MKKPDHVFVGNDCVPVYYRSWVKPVRMFDRRGDRHELLIDDMRDRIRYADNVNRITVAIKPNTDLIVCVDCSTRYDMNFYSDEFEITASEWNAFVASTVPDAGVFSWKEQGF